MSDLTRECTCHGTDAGRCLRHNPVSTLREIREVCSEAERFRGEAKARVARIVDCALNGER